MGAPIGQRDEAAIGEVHDEEAVVGIGREVRRRADGKIADRALPLPVAASQSHATNCRIGAGSVVLRDVPDDSTVVGVPGHVIFRGGKRVVITDPKQINDPLSEALAAVATEVKKLSERMSHLEGAGADPVSDSMQRIMEDVDYQI